MLISLKSVVTSQFTLLSVFSKKGKWLVLLKQLFLHNVLFKTKYNSSLNKSALQLAVAAATDEHKI